MKQKWWQLVLIFSLVVVISQFIMFRNHYGTSGTKDIIHHQLLSTRLQHVYDRPFDGKVNVLFLTSINFYETFMDRFFFHEYDATRYHSHINTTQLWAVPSTVNSYNPDLTLKENIQTIYGDPNFFDIIQLRSLDHYMISQVLEVVHSGTKEKRTLIAQRSLECDNPPFDKELRQAEINTYETHLVLFQYAVSGDCFEYLSDRRVSLNSPHAAEPKIFFKDAEESRSIDILQAGATYEAYPLRVRFRSIIERGLLKDYNAVVRQHPTWTPEFVKNESLNTEQKVHLLDLQVADYANQLKDAKIFVLDSGNHGYAYQKYVEGTMAGCLMVGTIPHEREHLWRQFVVEVNLNDSDEKIVEIINYWLSNDEARIKRAKIGQNIILHHFTYEHAVHDMIASHQHFLREEYGTYYPYGFRKVCTKDDRGKGACV